MPEHLSRKLPIKLIVAGIFALWAGIAVGVYWSLGSWQERGTFGDMFGAVNALFSGLALAGVIYAVLLQMEELTIQRKQLAPRLHVQGVRCEHLGVGQSPVFFVKVGNSGATLAPDVTITIEAHLSTHGKAEYTDGKNHIVPVPANGNVEHFIKSGWVLREETIRAINQDGTRLRVTGAVTYKDAETAYCYKYNPGDVPGMPSFIPCNWDTRRIVSGSSNAGTIADPGTTVNISMPFIGPTATIPPGEP